MAPTVNFAYLWWAALPASPAALYAGVLAYAWHAPRSRRSR